MPQLIRPDPRFRTSFLAAVQENLAEGEYFGNSLKRELAVYGDSWHEADGFARYVAAVREEELEEGRRPEGFVPGSWYWYVDGETYLGRIQLRHRLTPHLRDYGGHIGYGVRPTARRNGYATAMLRDVLPYARALGLDRVLVTCDTTNVGSRKVIEANRGEFEDERDGKLRFWIRTGR
ncbi:GNAT family N-acetyltransferase [Streptomyces sp. HC44]|uniref:GNAT family N-acetyltransferase n=1 Tax=Streptomyces scabichelini TaxID=2711217 RepID=A0A6G4V6K5_9ACTN|nr:GNAT family N-acetyltransferase [Streptomyces scabichelini]NGO09722.1 GNAT family N-acetyltransferase [Streptomyces scabichelini]